MTSAADRLAGGLRSSPSRKGGFGLARPYCEGVLWFASVHRDPGRHPRSTPVAVDHPSACLTRLSVPIHHYVSDCPALAAASDETELARHGLQVRRSADVALRARHAGHGCTELQNVEPAALTWERAEGATRTAGESSPGLDHPPVVRRRAAHLGSSRLLAGRARCRLFLLLSALASQ
jgi:hypothetical protein